ncbi:hypothetical protein N7472_010341 [Penicillium cf. griseofulvum]|uniref:Uncharacterized protein n=1 Tax=Penicillium cf. griseofulvum TaxID=2972120 RepID=A0A9W9M0Y2_9EURO|nr:hypothetical protein N7472_010341 [Penicillium cf. griseofulvum]
MACVVDTFRGYATTQSLQLEAEFVRQGVTARKCTCYSRLIQSFWQGGPRTTVHARLSPVDMEPGREHGNAPPEGNDFRFRNNS